MKILLDTHILLQVLENQGRALAAPVHRAIRSPDHILFVSVASLWEIAIKWRLKKLELSQPPEILPELIKAIGLRLIDIAAGHVLTSLDPEPVTRDPFDRLLLAQCQVESMQLLTIDRALMAHPLSMKLQ